MGNSSSQNDDNNSSSKGNNLIAWRMNPNLIPMFKDLSNQAYEAHLIHEPKLTSLAKFSLFFFAEMWLQQKVAQARQEEQKQQT
jgi:hypothetical protein